MQRLTRCVLGLTLLLAGCRLDPDRPRAEASRPISRAQFGRTLQGLSKTPLAHILKHPEQYEGRTVAVEGRVTRACTRKGCWLELADGQGSAAPSCRVTFENYSFFVPKDSPGARARLEGKVISSRVEVAHVEHLESEGARFASKNSDGSAVEVQIVATGVELERDGELTTSL